MRDGNNKVSNSWRSPAMNDLVWIGPALVSGLLAVRFGLPPLVGYLIAGFILNALDFNDHEDLSAIGELGVTLLLFTIGLKLDFGDC